MVGSPILEKHPRFNLLIIFECRNKPLEEDFRKGYYNEVVS
jgi:hypothetical protein